jgi:RNA polymerase sigma factor for flagellar operon FliA
MTGLLQQEQGMTVEAREAAAQLLWEHFASCRSVEARNDLLIHYAYLVKIIVNRLVPTHGRHAEYDDLMNNGILGLIDAIEKFDARRMVKFETYASLRIRGEIIDHMRRQDWAPVSLRKKIKTVSFAINTLEERLGRQPTEDEIAGFLGLSVPDLLKTLEATQALNILYIEELKTGSDSGREPGSSEGDVVSSHYEKKEMKEIIAKLIETLPENERLVITLYYYEEMTMKEIALTLGVTEPRVSQIHSKVLSKLRGKLG